MGTDEQTVFLADPDRTGGGIVGIGIGGDMDRRHRKGTPDRHRKCNPDLAADHAATVHDVAANHCYAANLGRRVGATPNSADRSDNLSNRARGNRADCHPAAYHSATHDSSRHDSHNPAGYDHLGYYDVAPRDCADGHPATPGDHNDNSGNLRGLP